MKEQGNDVDVSTSTGLAGSPRYYHIICYSVYFVLQPDDVVDVAVDKINARLESYLGINDNELGKYSQQLVVLHQISVMVLDCD